MLPVEKGVFVVFMLYEEEEEEEEEEEDDDDDDEEEEVRALLLVVLVLPLAGGNFRLEVVDEDWSRANCCNCSVVDALVFALSENHRFPDRNKALSQQALPFSLLAIK